MPQKPTTLVVAFGSAARHSATGSIVSNVQGLERRIWLRAGKVVFAESADPNEGFAVILAFRGILLEKERMAIAAVTPPGMREDLAIASSGILGPVEVMEHAKVVLEERLAIDFMLPGAVWTVDGNPPPEDLPSVGLPIASLVLDAARKHLTPDRLAAELPVEDGDVYAFRSAALAGFPGLNLGKEESRLTAALDGKKSFAEVVEETEVPRDVAHAALYALAVLGIAEYVPAGVAAATASAAVADGSAPPQPPQPAAPAVTPTASQQNTAALGKGVEMRERLLKEIPELLEIDGEATAAVVEDAFRSLVALYDLGRAHFLPEADRDAALSLLDRIIEVFLVLTNPQTRKKYLAAPAWDREVQAASLGAQLAGEKGWVKAGIFLQAGNYLAAEAALLPAIQANPREPRYYLRMGIAIYLRSKARGDKGAPAGALRALQKAIAFDPKCDEAYVYLGHIAAQAGDDLAAKSSYETALTLNPASGEARRALQRLGA